MNAQNKLIHLEDKISELIHLAGIQKLAAGCIVCPCIVLMMQSIKHLE
jgi:hypothetical protein